MILVDEEGERTQETRVFGVGEQCGSRVEGKKR